MDQMSVRRRCPLFGVSVIRGSTVDTESGAAVTVTVACIINYDKIVLLIF